MTPTVFRTSVVTLLALLAAASTWNYCTQLAETNTRYFGFTGGSALYWLEAGRNRLEGNRL